MNNLKKANIKAAGMLELDVVSTECSSVTQVWSKARHHPIPFSLESPADRDAVMQCLAIKHLIYVKPERISDWDYIADNAVFTSSGRWQVIDVDIIVEICESYQDAVLAAVEAVD